MNWVLAHDFVRNWFGSGNDQVVLTGRGKDKHLINMSAATLLTRLRTGGNDGIAALSGTLGDMVLAYPWLKPASDTRKRKIQHDDHLVYSWVFPGYWADLPAHATQEATDALSDQLDTVGLAPSMLTGMINADNGTIRSGRLWWCLDRADDNDTPSRQFVSNQRQWQRFVQAVAIDHGIFTHMSIRDPRLLNMVQTPLPGTIDQGDLVQVVQHRDLEDSVDSRFVEWHRDDNAYIASFDAQQAEVDGWLRDLGTMANPIYAAFDARFKTWDDVLVPHGWWVCGNGTDIDGKLVTWWVAPGANSPTALTKDNSLMLYDSTWLTGLKIPSDCGAHLDRVKVASLLWWDGDIDAMHEDIMSMPAKLAGW